MYSCNSYSQYICSASFICPKNKQSCAFISLQLTEEGPNEVRQKTNCGKNFIDHSVQDVNLSSGQRNLIKT